MVGGAVGQGTRSCLAPTSRSAAVSAKSFQGRRTVLLALSFVPSQLLANRNPARASIPLKNNNLAGVRNRDLPVPSREKGLPGSTSSEGALESFLEARALVASGDYAAAFEKYDAVVNTAPGSSGIAEYSRLGRAITRYEVGDKRRAVIEIEYEVLNTVGIPEAHAALASASWASGKASLAETQWEVAMEFDKRFSDVAWVKKNYHWGPELMGALESFLNLS